MLNSKQLLANEGKLSISMESKFKTVPSCSSERIFDSYPLNAANISPIILQRLQYRVNVLKQEKPEYKPIRILEKGFFSGAPKKTKFLSTGSNYTGSWSYVGMDGTGIYEYPNGSVYTGSIINGLFSGYGVLRFPNGGLLRGFWIQGVLYNPQYIFNDGLVYKPQNWKYCKIPDRRFHSEIINGLKPSGNIQLASDHPARAIPPGHYDLVEGFYNPLTKEVIHPIHGNVIRIASKIEQDWILRNCRREWQIPVPFNPYIYENWFPKVNEGRHKHLPEKSLWAKALRLRKERTGLNHRIYAITKKWPNLLKESALSLLEIGSQMDRCNVRHIKRNYK